MHTPDRQFVDPGAATYHDFISSVPLANKTEMCIVEPAVREANFPPSEDLATASAANNAKSDEKEDKRSKNPYSKRFSGRALMRANAETENVPPLSYSLI